MKRVWPLLLVGIAVLTAACESNKSIPAVVVDDPPPEDTRSQSRSSYSDPAYAQPNTYDAHSSQTNYEAVPAQRDPVVMEDPGTTSINNEQRLSPRGGSTARKSASTGGGGGRTYTVKKGDSLSKIAQKYYGNGNRWQRIYNANRSKLKSPNDLKVGQKLVIP